MQQQVQSDAELIRRHVQAGPRYTSNPTANRFQGDPAGVSGE